MKASRGSIVDFNHMPSAGGGHTVSPAMVHSINDKGEAILHIFGPNGTRVQPGVTQGDAPNQWNFPSEEKDGDSSGLPPVALPSASGNKAD